MASPNILHKSHLATRIRERLSNDLNVPIIDFEALDDAIFEMIGKGGIRERSVIVKLLLEGGLLSEEHLSTETEIHDPSPSLLDYIDEICLMWERIKHDQVQFERFSFGWWCFRR